MKKLLYSWIFLSITQTVHAGFFDFTWRNRATECLYDKQSFQTIHTTLVNSKDGNFFVSRTKDTQTIQFTLEDDVIVPLKIMIADVEQGRADWDNNAVGDIENKLDLLKNALHTVNCYNTILDTSYELFDEAENLVEQYANLAPQQAAPDCPLKVKVTIERFADRLSEENNKLKASATKRFLGITTLTISAPILVYKAVTYLRNQVDKKSNNTR